MRSLTKQKRGNQLDEQMDILCMRIEEGIAKEPVMLMVSYAGKEDSRAIITCKLASLLANRGKKVLLVDTNFENPSLHEWFRTNSLYGFSDLLIDGPSQQMYKETMIEGFTFLPAGSKKDVIGRRLEPNYEKELLKWKKVYDIVLFQAPSAQVSNPPSFVTKACEGVIFLVKERKDKKKDITKLAEHYMKLGKYVAGVIYQKT